MKTQGEIEAAICVGIGRFEQEYMGRGPEDIHAHLIRDIVVVRPRADVAASRSPGPAPPNEKAPGSRSRSSPSSGKKLDP